MSSRWMVAPLRVPPIRTSRWVVRFGGSLLTRPGWPQDLLDLVGGLTGAVTIVVGGGPVVDGLRVIDAAEPMPAPVMHALAIEAMGLTGRLVAAADAVAAPALAGSLEGLRHPLTAAQADAVATLASLPQLCARSGATACWPLLVEHGFGRSDFRSRLREHFEVNRHYIVVAALKALADEGALPAQKVAEAIAKYGIVADKINPLYA